ncbi:hypothetical protein B0T16DRAFT_176734 [Cercophora newfieldiana]|uniref:Uncharacterized protein n=1 Tax=Cercophora newfieldiana TaxID=92897 RepID=A0AA40CL94_9PEZI|nr:hypothetical protein B0T16DRAFT_176734 [Cercophora newfieldiana]
MKSALGLVAVGCALGTANGKATKWGRDRNEREYRPAQETLGAMPSLLNAPAPMTTSPPRYVPRELEKRASTDNTCAYVSGSADFPLYCDATAYCASNSLNSHVGCCPDTATTTCNVWTTCLDSAQRSLFTTDNGFTLWCGFSSFPHCITHIYRDTSGAATALQGYTLLGCAVAAGTDSVFYNPFIFSTSSPRRTTPITTAPISISSTSTSARATTTVTQTPTPTPASAPTPVAAIAGGVVGGVAALSLIIFGIWFLIRQNNKSKDENDQPSPPAPGPGGPPPPFAGYSMGPTGGTPATQMSQQPGNGYFAPQQPEVAGVAGFAALGHNQRSSIAKPGYTGYEQQQHQQQQYNVPGGGGSPTPPPASPPLYSTSGAQGTPSPPLGGDGRYSSYGQSQGQPGAGSPPMDAAGFAAAGAGYHRESQSTQGGYQAQRDSYARQPSDNSGAWQDGGYAQDRYHPSAPQRESYPPPAPGGYQQDGYQQQDNYQQPPAARESYQQTYQVHHPPAAQGPGGYQQSQGGYQASQPQPPTNYRPPGPVYQPHPAGGYQSGSGYTAELPTARGDGEVRELQG